MSVDLSRIKRVESGLLSVPVIPDWRGLIDCIRRKGTPERVHVIELFLDREMQDAVTERFGLVENLDPGDPHWGKQRLVVLNRFLGYDYVRVGADNLVMPLTRCAAEDTADLKRSGGRNFMEEHRGPITNWEEFHAYPWPDLDVISADSMEWFSDNLPDDMCIIAGGGFAHFCEHITWLMGYETLCYALFEQRDLVKAIADRITEVYVCSLELMLPFERVKAVWGSDDMGFKSGTLISPTDLREFVLPGHKRMAEMAHATGRPYLLHSCGKLDEIMDDLIEDVGIDAKHSFEDVIEPVTEAKAKYGDRIALLGGIDVDFLCRADEAAIRKRVRETLDACQPGGGYCLGTGNSVANYIPLDNYLVMLDEGRRWGRGN